LDRRLGEPQSLSGRGGEEKNSQPLSGIEPPISENRGLRGIFGTKKEEVAGGWTTLHNEGFIICKLYQIF